MVWDTPIGVASRSLEFIIPPLALTSTSSPCLYAALHRHGQIRHINECQEAVLAAAKTKILWLECDRASGNDKYQAHLAQRYHSNGVLSDVFFCANHANNLAEVNIVTSAWQCTLPLGLMTKSLTSDLYSATLFLRIAQLGISTVRRHNLSGD